MPHAARRLVPHLRASLQLPGLTQAQLMLVDGLARTPPQLAELAHAPP
jgi:hypothetical protein